jgi:hypothetical protein
MPTPIGIPKLGWEMEEGTLIECLIPDGEHWMVQFAYQATRGDVIVTRRRVRLCRPL